jgi:hypothetical protein
MSGRRFAIILLCLAACGCAADQAVTELPIAAVANPAKGAVLTECLGEIDYVLKGALQKPGQS